MKIILSLAMLVWSVSLFAQTYPEPEFANQPYYFDRDNNQLMLLEKATAKMKTKAKALGYGGTSSGWQIDGKHSKVVLTRSDSVEFVITGFGGSSHGMDPSSVITLYKLTVNKKDDREITTMETGGFGSSKTKENDDKKDFNVKKVGDKTIFVITGRLQPGEYAFINMMEMGQDQTVKAYCFRVQ